MIVFWWILLGYLVVLPFLLIGIGEYLIALSFYINAPLIAYMTRISVIKNSAGPTFAAVNVFIILFFYSAPIYQLVEYKGYLINNYNASADQMLWANIIVFIFTASFIAAYLKRRNVVHTPLLQVSDESIGKIFPVLIALAVAAAIWAIWVMSTYSLEAEDDAISAGVNIGITIRHKVAFVIPFAALGFYLSRKNVKRSWVMLGLLILLMICSKNIILDRRNSLGPVYLAFISLLFWRGNIKSRQVFMLVGPALLFVFPLLSIFINHPIDTWGELLQLDNVAKEIRGHFVDMHYDAWANLVASIQYVKTEGLQLGRQLMGSVLFWFPRSIWIDKPVSSGQMLGDYLVLNSGLWFTNISFPLPAEGYVDFGILGVLAYGIVLGLYSQRLDYLVNHGGVVARTSSLYFAFYMMFVMRGSFLPAFAFGVGALIAMNLLPAMLARLWPKSRFSDIAPNPAQRTRPIALR
ncbi:MAG: hypothetical protein EOO77_06665 [Oxalobacteraceae bacterium]|nr:MAG: hypothetical protein EOO77_06665 [Oxalobacteraceae bacterium]